MLNEYFAAYSIDNPSTQHDEIRKENVRKVLRFWVPNKFFTIIYYNDRFFYIHSLSENGVQCWDWFAVCNYFTAVRANIKILIFLLMKKYNVERQ